MGEKLKNSQQYQMVKAKTNRLKAFKHYVERD